MQGEITVWDPPSTFEWIWDGETIRFELTPTDDGTRLVLTTKLPPESPLVGATAGYHALLDQLTLLLDGENPPQFVPDDTVARLEAKYEALLKP